MARSVRFDCQRLEGLHKARGEWALVCMSHNVRRLHAAARWRDMFAGRVAPTG
jgi:hypothetical protein